MAATTTSRSPFAQAIDEFLEEMKAGDRKGLFYKEVLTSRSMLALTEDPDGVKHCADSLTGFVEELKKEKRTSQTLRALDALGPFIKSLKVMMDACSDILQASPFAVGVAFGAARFVLQVSADRSR